MIPRLAEFEAAPVVRGRWNLFRRILPQIRDGQWAEFGTASGTSARFLASLLAARDSVAVLWCFDTYGGMPTDWWEGRERFALRGEAGCSAFTDPPFNVRLVEGLYDETLPLWVGEQGPWTDSATDLTFLHVDCDLEESAECVLRTVPIGPGTVLVFDEFYRTVRRPVRWQALGEARAWSRVAAEMGWEWSYLARNPNWRVAIRVG